MTARTARKGARVPWSVGRRRVSPIAVDFTGASRRRGRRVDGAARFDDVADACTRAAPRAVWWIAESGGPKQGGSGGRACIVAGDHLAARHPVFPLRGPSRRPRPARGADRLRAHLGLGRGSTEPLVRALLQLLTGSELGGVRQRDRILDEATSLDEPSEAKVYRLLQERLPRATIISIGHRSTLHELHDRHLSLHLEEGQHRMQSVERPLEERAGVADVPPFREAAPAWASVRRQKSFNVTPLSKRSTKMRPMLRVQAAAAMDETARPTRLLPGIT